MNASNNNTKISNSKFAVIDFETTGTSSKKDRAIEVGIVIVENLKIVASYQSFINPGRNLPYYITKLTGITDDDLHDAPYFEEIVSEMLDFIGDSVLTAHNLPFDMGFLKTEFNRAEVILPKYKTLCTLKLARKLYPELKSKSLGNLVKYFGITHKNVHRALGDAMVTAKLLIKMSMDLSDSKGITKLNELLAYQTTVPQKVGLRIIKKKLSIDFSNAPTSPGVYIFKNSKGNIIYIGKAKILNKRVANYFSNNAIKKAKEIVKKSSHLEYITTNTELTALLLESELIKKHKPPMNKMLKKYSKHYFIRIKQNHEAPSLSSVSKIDFDGNDYFGPYRNRDTVKNLIDIVNKTFLVRECSDKEYRRKRKCYLYDIKRCLAPCIYANIDEYQNELSSVYEFLSGVNQNAINKLLNKMKFLSQEQRYEEAADIRDIVNQILNQLNRSSILAEPINKTNAVIKISHGIKNDFLLFINGKVIIKDKINKDLFQIYIDDFYNTQARLDENPTEKDLSRMKIALSWLVFNRNYFKVFYLNDFNSSETLFNTIEQ